MEDSEHSPLQVREPDRVDQFDKSLARSELLATVAHELRNPIAAIHCAVRALDTPDRGELTVQQVRTVIDQQLMRLARLCDDLLSVGYAETGKLELRKEAVDVRDVINASAEACRPLFDAGMHTLIRLLPPMAVSVEADPLRLIQVVTNLLDNAAKYSKRGSSVVIRVEQSAREVAIRIVDHGIGIGAEFLPRVFDLFSQSDQARAHSRHGLGIGLNLVKRIVELHHGVVDAFSAGPELGSTFTVRLPRNASEQCLPRDFCARNAQHNVPVSS